MTDLDSELGRVKRATAFFQQQPPFLSNPKVLSGAAALNPLSKPAMCDPYYDTVPREEHSVDGWLLHNLFSSISFITNLFIIS